MAETNATPNIAVTADVKTLNCKISIPDVKGLDAGKMTVGRHLILDCSGQSVAGFDFSKAVFKTENKNLARIFKIETQAENAFKADFTIYLAAPFKLEEFPLTDGTNELLLKADVVTVESVIKPPDDGKPPQPFGSVFPIGITIPISYYIILLAAIVLTGVFTFFKARRLAYYSNLKTKLSEHNSPIDSETQFYRSIRALEKSGYPLAEVESAFRLYNLRSYKIPLFDLNDESAIRYFKRNYPEYKNTRLQLQKFLSDFEERRKDPTSFASENRADFVKKLYRYVEKNKGISS